MVLDPKKVLLSAPNVEIEMSRSIEGNRMCFRFKGTFSKETASVAARSWSKKFDESPQTKYRLVWDCSEMKNFDYSARDEWMNTLTKLSNQISDISVVSDSILIRGAARVMSKFSNLNLKTYKSVNEIDD